jgi:RNA polymerase sigma factor (sigma-70 family)
VQPENKETGPGLLLPLIHLYQRHPESTVVVFPSDHFILEEDLFMVHVELAFRVVERNPSRVVLLGMEPSGVESAYGCILPVQRVESVLPLCVREVSQFIEKPKRPSVQELILKGALWNTMVMVFKAETLLDLVRRAAPTLYRFFNSISEAIGTAGETDAVGEAYKQLEPVNFSQELLEPLSLQRPSPLWVLPVRGVHWSDWGSESRIMSALQKTGHLGRLNGISTKQGLQDKEPSAGWRNRPRSKWLPLRWPQSCLGNLVKDEHSPDPEGVLIDLNRQHKTRRILTTLSPREEKITRMRFGIGEKTEYTLEETGKVFGVTRERIRQIEAAALRKLRQPQRIVTLKAVTATDT